MQRYCGFIVPVLAGSCAFGQASFEGLGVLPGEAGSDAMDVSRDGSVVTGVSGTLGTGESYLWEVGAGMNRLGGGFADFGAQGLSADGLTVVGVGFDPSRAGEFAFRWDAAGGMMDLGVLPGETSSVAFGVSGDGGVVVGRSGLRPFRWDGVQGMLPLGSLAPGFESGEAMSASDDGEAIVGWSVSSAVAGGEAFLWTPTSRMQGLGDLPGGDDESIAFDVSSDGSVVVGASRSDNGLIEAFRWTQRHGMVGIGTVPGHFRSVGFGVSADGNRVIGRVADQTHEEAFIWEPSQGMRHLSEVLEEEYGLSLGEWELSHAEKISSDGTTIVGNGIDWGQTAVRAEGWRVVLPAYCASDCDRSSGGGVLDVFDFLCFQDQFVRGEVYACDCDVSTGIGVCDVFDFLCFQDGFVAGCP